MKGVQCLERSLPSNPIVDSSSSLCNVSSRSGWLLVVVIVNDGWVCDDEKEE